MNPMASVLIKNRREDPCEGREKETETEMGGCGLKPRNAWTHQKLEEARKDSLLKPLEGV